MPLHLLLVLLACLASQLLMPQATAQSTTTYTEDPLATPQSTAEATIYYTDDPFTVFAACPAGFTNTNCTEANAAAQCQGDCCFYAGYCTSSTDNNCDNVEGSFFPPTPGDKMVNHPSSQNDGCFCNFFLTEITEDGPERLPCNQSTVGSSNSCWGVIACDLSLNGTSGFTCSTDGINEDGVCGVRPSGWCVRWAVDEENNKHNELQDGSMTRNHPMHRAPVKTSDSRGTSA